ncbi:hypothetical protein [Lysobacter olei]
MESHKLMLDPVAIRRRLFLTVFVLIAINVALQAYRLVMHQESVMGLPMLSLDKENNVPALFSTILLLAASMILAFIALLERGRGGPDTVKWTILSAGFLAMGVDESLSIHERLIDPLRGILGDSLGVERLGIFYFAWVIPAIVLVIGLGIYFLPFVRRLPLRTGVMLLVSGVVYLGGAIGVELLEGWWREGHGHRNMLYHALVSLEEGMEMVGIILLIHTLLDFLSARYGEVRLALVGRGSSATVQARRGAQTAGGHVLGRSATE